MDQELKELIDKLNKLLDEKNGLRVSGMGMLAENTKKILDKLDKIDTKLYWIEKRDKERNSNN